MLEAPSSLKILLKYGMNPTYNFFQSDYIRVFELQCEIFDLKRDSRSIYEYFNALTILWEDLEAYFPTPVVHVCTDVYAQLTSTMPSITMKLLVPFIF